MTKKKMLETTKIIKSLRKPRNLKKNTHLFNIWRKHNRRSYQNEIIKYVKCVI